MVSVQGPGRRGSNEHSYSCQPERYQGKTSGELVAMQGPQPLVSTEAGYVENLDFYPDSQ